MKMGTAANSVTTQKAIVAVRDRSYRMPMVALPANHATP